MIMHCLQGMSAFGSGWMLAAILIVATAAGTYLVTKRADTSSERAEP